MFESIFEGLGLQAPEAWDGWARLALFGLLIGCLIVHHAVGALSDDLGAYRAKPLGYFPIWFSIVLGAAMIVVGGYFFSAWAAI